MTDTYVNVERLTLFKRLLFQYLAPIQHNHSAEDIVKMTGYSKAETAADISANDSLNVAIGKLEKALDGKGTSNLTIGNTATTAAAGNHTHTISISTSEGTSQRTLEYGGKYVLTAGGSSFVFTMPQATSSSVTSVAGKTGAVTLDKNDVGLGNVGNFKAVSTAASQGLTSTEKTNARNNIGAGTSNLALGETSTTAAAGNHTHTLSIATSEGTSSLTLAYDSKYALTAGGSTFIFKMPAAQAISYPVTSVAGKTGAVTLDKNDVGLGNVGNFKAVSTVASQGLTATEKSNARNNIGAGTSSLTLGTTASTAAAGNHTHSQYATKTEAYATGLGLEISTWPASQAASDASTSFHNHLRDTDTACGRTKGQIDTSTTLFIDPSISIIYFNTSAAQKIRYIMPSGDVEFPNGKRITLVGNFYTGEKDTYSEYAIDPYGYSKLLIANPMAAAGTSPMLTNFSSIADYADSSSVHVDRQQSMEFIFWNKKWYSRGYETTLAINEVTPDITKSSLPVTSGAVYSYLIACDYASKSYVGSNYASSGHTHNTTIASSDGTSSLTLAYGSKYSLTAGGKSFIFTMPAAPSYPVISVAGKTGAVTLDKSDVGLGNVGNFKAVSTAASQGLTDTEKSNARNNIGAGTSSLAIGTTASTAAAGNHNHDSSYVKIDGSNGTAAGVSALMNKLAEGTTTPQDADYYISQYAGGGTSTTTYHRRPMSALWTYIQSKISSVLGLTSTAYGGNAATATKATQDGSGNVISTSYLKLSGGVMTGNIGMTPGSNITSCKIYSNNSNQYIGFNNSGNIGLYATTLYLRNKVDSSGNSSTGLILHTNGYAQFQSTPVLIDPTSSSVLGGYSQGLRINLASDNWSLIHLGGTAGSTSGTNTGGWTIGRRGTAVNSNAGVFGDIGDLVFSHNGTDGNNCCVINKSGSFVSTGNIVAKVDVRVGASLTGPAGCSGGCNMHYNSNTQALEFQF